MLFSFTIILGLITLIVCFLRANFADVKIKLNFLIAFIQLVIVFGLFAFIMPDNRTFNHFYMRCWLFFIAYNIIADLVWLALYTDVPI